MRVPKFLIPAILSGAAFSALANPSLSSDSIHMLRSARSQADHGQRSRAQAALDCLLMTHGVSVGMEWPGAMSRAVEHGVQTWGDRLDDCPFRFTTRPNPDIKVRFVDDIQSGGDVQGQVQLQRYVRWGSGGASYHLKGTILVRDNVEGRRLSSSEVAAVVEHELGHVLGLDDADQTGELMGPFVPGEPMDGPTDEEVAKVASFRSTVRRTLAEISGGYGGRSASRR